MAKDPQVVDIPLEKLTISKFNVRRELGDISELVDSIKTVGVLQPILVRPIGKDRYEVIVGSRRFAAAQKAKLKTIPAIVKEMSDDEAIIESLVENIQRGDLEIEEIAEAYNIIRKLDKRYTQEVLAKKIGKSREWLSTIFIAYQSLIKLRQAGKPYRIKERPTEEEREKGVLPYTFLAEVEYALKSEEVRKVFPESKIDDVRVMLIEAIKDLNQDDAKRVLNYFKMYPEKPIEEIRNMALARKAGVELKTFVPASVMRKVEETAEKIGKPVEVILPTVLERGIEEEAKKVEVERLLEKAPSYLVEVARKMEATMTPTVVQKLMELPERKRKDAVRWIESLRLTEKEALAHIESMKAEVAMPPAEEMEKIRERYEKLKEEIRSKLETPEAKERGELFRNWTSHIAVAGILDTMFCPICKSKRLGWICHNLEIKDALNEAEKKYKESVGVGD
ncbi:MAG: ParB/RepB/Spo0J family partition protein [Candidatus Bathyarchaeia archaeon]